MIKSLPTTDDEDSNISSGWLRLPFKNFENIIYRSQKNLTYSSFRFKLESK